MACHQCEGPRVFSSPLEAQAKGAREQIVYIPAVLGHHGPGAAADYLATVDVDPSSATYGQVIHRLPMPFAGDELHHMGWNACSSCPDGATHQYLVVPGVLSGNVYFIDVRTDPRAPRHHKLLRGSELSARFGLSLPHTSHCTPDAIVMSFMAGRKEDGLPGSGNGFLQIDPHTLEPVGRWEHADHQAAKPGYGYDFWLHYRKNVLIASEWGEPACFAAGFDPAHVAAGKYGHRLYVWDWTTRKLLQQLELGVGSVPLEVRFLHDPERAVGFVGCALSSSIVRFAPADSGDGSWTADEVFKIEPLPVDGWALPAMPALITDFCISLDDRYLYLANWLHGDVRQLDITDTARPRQVGQVFIGGSLSRGGGVTVTDPHYVQPEPLVVKGVRIQGGAQMIQLSLDGKRLYVSTSLFSAWDKQFYPGLVANGAQLLQIDVDTERGGLTINPNFVVDFGAEPWGPALCHEMRFPGGDCTSDIWP